jgi:hypothetical protein
MFEPSKGAEVSRNISARGLVIAQNGAKTEDCIVALENFS